MNYDRRYREVWTNGGPHLRRMVHNHQRASKQGSTSNQTGHIYSPSIFFTETVTIRYLPYCEDDRLARCSIIDKETIHKNARRLRFEAMRSHLKRLLGPILQRHAFCVLNGLSIM
jgi:hypothetical protein